MSSIPSDPPVAHLVDQRRIPCLDVLGPTVEYLTAPGDDAPCVMRGTIPAGGIVPLHSHGDPETFIMVAGGVEALAGGSGALRWVPVGPGDVFHVPGGAKHAFRNRAPEPASMILVTTARLGRYFQDIGVPATPGLPVDPPSPDRIERFLEVARAYGYWNATPEENAAVGLALPFARA